MAEKKINPRYADLVGAAAAAHVKRRGDATDAAREAIAALPPTILAALVPSLYGTAEVAERLEEVESETVDRLVITGDTSPRIAALTVYRLLAARRVAELAGTSAMPGDYTALLEHLYDLSLPLETGTANRRGYRVSEPVPTTLPEVYAWLHAQATGA